MIASMGVVFQSCTVHVATPDGEMFVNIMEDEQKKPIQIQITIGKSGTSIAAWTDAMSRLVNMMLKKGGSLEDVIVELSSITSSKFMRLTEGVSCRSGPEGLVIALLKYRNSVTPDSTDLDKELFDLSRPARMYQ